MTGSVPMQTRSQGPHDPLHGSAKDRPFAHALLFTGHMIDRPEREHPRFPASAEARVRAALREAMQNIRWAQAGATIGLAAAASGGDILFHEVCAELAIPTRILLALPVDDFVSASVATAGPRWVERFHFLVQRTPPENMRVMGDGGGPSDASTDDVWQRANLWMMEEAAALAPEQALLALWDGHVGDGPGGTEHFIQTAQRRGIRILPVLSMQSLCDAPNAAG